MIVQIYNTKQYTDLSIVRLFWYVPNYLSFALPCTFLIISETDYLGIYLLGIRSFSFMNCLLKLLKLKFLGRQYSQIFPWLKRISANLALLFLFLPSSL